MPQQSRGFRQKPDTGDTGKAPGSSQSKLTALERGRRSMADAEARKLAKASEQSIEERLAVIERQVEERLKIQPRDEPSPPLNVSDTQGVIVSPGPHRAFERASTSHNAVLGYRDSQSRNPTTPSTRLSGMTTGDSVERDIAAYEQKSGSTEVWAQKGGNVRKRRAHFGSGEVTTIGEVKGQTSAPQSSEILGGSGSRPLARGRFETWQPTSKELEAMQKGDERSKRFESELSATEAGNIGTARAEQFVDRQKELANKALENFKEIRRRTQGGS